MAVFDSQNARLANLTRSSLARPFETKSESLWDAGVRQELRAWLSLGEALDYFPTDSENVEMRRRVFGVSLEEPDQFADLFEEWSTIEKHQLHPYLQSALLLTDHLHADSAACRLLSTIAFSSDRLWDRSVRAQTRLMDAVPRHEFEALIQIAGGATWLLDGTVRLLHHLGVFHAWVENVALHLAPVGAERHTLPLVRAVAQIQRWRLDVSDVRRAARLEQVVAATQQMRSILARYSRRVDNQDTPNDQTPLEPLTDPLATPTVVFGVRLPVSEV